MINTICIAGAGTMGAGIAQLAAQSGFVTLLFDVNEAVLERARENIQKQLVALADKQKISAKEKEAVFNRIYFINDINKCKADLIIEAIVENIEAKLSVFHQLNEINKSSTIFATNTSSLSVSSIQSLIKHPERFAGMHFFNPAPVMKLVEVVKGNNTSYETIQAITEVCTQMNKVAVQCTDAPGFIVNRVARHYYLEAMKLVENGIATIENVDTIMEASGFKMGPFKLMDLIGIDINLAVSESIYNAFNKTERFVPSQLQVNKVKNGELGRKTKKGFYIY